MLSPQVVQKVLDAALSRGADFAEIFAEDTETQQLTVIDSKPSRCLSGQIRGAGIRLWYGHDVIYQTVSNLEESALVQAALTAAGAKLGSAKNRATAFERFDRLATVDLNSDLKKNFSTLINIDRKIREQSSDVVQAKPMLESTLQRVLIANSQGVWAEEVRPYTRVYWTVLVERDGKQQLVSDRLGYQSTVEKFYDEHFYSMLPTTVQRGIRLLTAQAAPAGEFPVVIESGFGGVIFHEACGHGLETTAVAKNASVFCDKLGSAVANACVTAIDDGTIPGEWGSLKFDDEGHPTQKTVLIENGILKSYMADQLGAKKTGYKATGSGRRESYKYAPTSRMRNTFIAPGESSTDEMIRDIDFGIYAVKMGGGSVAPGTGEYNFGVDEAYLIENGKVTAPIRGATLIGRGIETLGRITKVGRDLVHESGMCGSVSGSIPAAVGQPAILVSKILVGGQAQ